MDANGLAQVIANEIVAQGNEIDNLGDNESIVLTGKCPTVNLVQLAEKIVAVQTAGPAPQMMLELLADIDDVADGKLPEISAATLTRARQAATE